MTRGKPVVLALLAALALSSGNLAFADKGGRGPHHAVNPSVNLGLPAVPKMGIGVGLPAAAMGAKAGPGSTPLGGSGPGQNAGSGISAQMAAPGATRSVSSAGLTPPGQSNQPNRGASDVKSGEAQEKLAALTGTATDSASVPVTSLSQLPTCR